MQNGGGTRITCSGLIEIGNDCTFTGECTICAQKKVAFGSECLISWNTQILDSDFHSIRLHGHTENEDSEVHIGEHVWICSNVIILKNTVVGNDCVVGAMSLLNRIFDGDNLIIAGNPAKVVKQNIEWEK